MRFKKHVNKFYKLSNWNNYFVIKIKNMSGRSKNGYMLLRTKKHNKNNFYLNLCKLVPSGLSLILNLCYSNYNNCFFFFVKNTNNQYYYIRSINGLFLGDFFKSISFNPRYITNFYLGFILFGKYLKKGLIISNIKTDFKKPKYIKAAGTYGHVLDIFKDLSLILLKLPSSRKKIVNFNSVVTIGRNNFIDKKYQFYSKAGILKNNGVASKVRGVAMNPVDHPHGGRTKTNSPEVSLWGWVAKHSR